MSAGGIGPGYGGSLPPGGQDYGQDQLVQGDETGDEAPVATPMTAADAVELSRSTAASGGGDDGMETVK